MKKYLPFSRRQPSLDRFSVSKGGWPGSDRFSGKSLRRTSAASLNTRSIQVVRGAYNIDLNKVDSSFTKLHRACLLNDEAQVRKHLLKVDNDSHDSSKRYPIHLAIVNGNFAIIKLLIENNANPNVQDNESNTPLIKAIECGHEHLVKYLLNNGADPNISDSDNNTALHWAITTESIIATDALISSKKCDLSLRNKKEETCLHLAARCPLINTQTFESMILAGVDLKAKDQLGLTILDIAKACNNKVALNVFDRFNPANAKGSDSGSPRNQADPDSTVTDDINRASNVMKLCEDYKQKYLTKNRENLEYEKKIINLQAKIESLMIDMGCLKEQFDMLSLDYDKLQCENAKLKDHTEQSSGRKADNDNNHFEEKSPVREDDDQDLDNSYRLDDLDSIDCCRAHEEFMMAKNINQEKIEMLKKSLTTIQH